MGEAYTSCEEHANYGHYNHADCHRDEKCRLLVEEGAAIMSTFAPIKSFAVGRRKCRQICRHFTRYRGVGRRLQRRLADRIHCCQYTRMCLSFRHCLDAIARWFFARLCPKSGIGGRPRPCTVSRIIRVLLVAHCKHLGRRRRRRRLFRRPRRHVVAGVVRVPTIDDCGFGCCSS